MNIDPLEHLERETRELTEYMQKNNRSAFNRYPLLFSLLGTFGVAAVLYGFEDILDTIPLFHKEPVVPLILGICILIGTGTLYKRIGKNGE